MNLITVGGHRINLDNVTRVEKGWDGKPFVFFNVSDCVNSNNPLEVNVTLTGEDADAFLWYWDKIGSDVLNLYQAHLKAEHKRLHQPSEGEIERMLEETRSERDKEQELRDTPSDHPDFMKAVKALLEIRYPNEHNTIDWCMGYVERNEWVNYHADTVAWQATEAEKERE